MRRVAIAGLLASRPRVLILDEPLAGLDREKQARAARPARAHAPHRRPDSRHHLARHRGHGPRVHPDGRGDRRHCVPARSFRGAARMVTAVTSPARRPGVPPGAGHFPASPARGSDEAPRLGGGNRHIAAAARVACRRRARRSRRGGCRRREAPLDGRPAYIVVGRGDRPARRDDVSRRAADSLSTRGPSSSRSCSSHCRSSSYGPRGSRNSRQRSRASPLRSASSGRPSTNGRTPWPSRYARCRCSATRSACSSRPVGCVPSRATGQRAPDHRPRPRSARPRSRDRRLGRPPGLRPRPGGNPARRHAISRLASTPTASAEGLNRTGYGLLLSAAGLRHEGQACQRGFLLLPP